MHDVSPPSARALRKATLSLAALSIGVAIAACSDSSTAPEFAKTSTPAISALVTHPAGILAKQTPLAGTPWGVDISINEVAYVTQLTSNQVAVTNTTAQTISNEIAVGNNPTAVAFSPDGLTAYVTNQSDGTLGVINVASGVQTSTIALPTGVSSFAVAAAPSGKTVFVSGNGTEVYVINAHTMHITDSIPVGSAPNAFALSPDEKFFYVSSFLGGTATQFNIANHHVVRTFTTGGTPQGLSTNMAGTELYVANEGGYVSLFKVSTGALITTLPLTAGGFGTAVSPDDNHLYVGEPSAGVVQIVNLVTHTVLKSIAVGGSPRRIAFNPTGKIAIVANDQGYLSFIK
jgi:YVTN family beta-propeller protein